MPQLDKITLLSQVTALFFIFIGGYLWILRSVLPLSIKLLKLRFAINEILIGQNATLNHSSLGIASFLKKTFIFRAQEEKSKSINTQKCVKTLLFLQIKKN